MIFDLQKASVWKRTSAWMFDIILLGILIAGLAFGMSRAFGYDDYAQSLNDAYDRYEQQYGTSFNLTQEAYLQLTPEQQKTYDEAYDALIEDPEAMHAYSMMISLSLTITSLSILAGYVIWELAVPFFLGNGQTLGKKIFGIGVIRTDGVKLSPVQLFIRTILGKYTIETMVPVLIVLMIYFGTLGLLGTVLILGLGILQIVLLVATPNHAPLHDVLAGTVVCDLASQMIFESREAMLEYKKEVSAEAAARAPY